MRKSKTKFSSIACDQAHEQTNKLIKSKSGLADVLNKEESAFLRKLENIIPEIHGYLEEIEGQSKPQKHKETATNFVKTYINDVRMVCGRISTNPFLEKGTRKVNSTMSMPACVVEDMAKVFDIGQVQYDTYKETRFVKGTADVLNTSIKTNKLKLPKDAEEYLVVNPMTPLSSSDAIKLRSSCSLRPELAGEIFLHDFTGTPECFLAKDGKTFHSNKAAIIKCLKPPGNEVVSLPGEFGTYIVDLSVEIRSKASLIKNDTYSYKQFIALVLDSIAIRAMQAKVRQIDIVADFYYNLSIKSGTRTDRGVSSRILFSLDDLISNNFESLLKNDEFKTDLNDQFSTKEVLEAWSWQGDFRVTKSTFVVERMDGVLSERMICFASGKPSLEEADNRLVLHVRDSILLNSRIKVRTLDSDVLIILVRFFYQFQSYNNDCELTVEFGVSSNREYINIKECVNHLGVGNSLAIPFFHAFTGSDSTSFFFKKSKINLFRAWQASKNYDVLTATFQQLSWLPKECSIIATLPVLQQFVIESYGG